MTIDNRTYFRLTPARFSALLCPAEFLAKRPIIKTPADEDEGTEAVYYTAADGLTIQQGIELSNIPVAYYDESGAAPAQVEAIEDCDRVVFGLWNLYGSEMRAFIGGIEALGEDPDEVILPAGNLGAYLKDGTLPTE